MTIRKNWKGRKCIHVNAVVPTNFVDKGKLMNLEKGYDLDAIWSEFNPDIRDQLTVSFKKTAILFFRYFVLLFSEMNFLFVESARPTH